MQHPVSSHLASRHRFFTVAILVAASSVAAHADLKWTETMSMGNQKGAPAISTTRWMNKNARRTTTSMAMGPVKTVTDELTLCESSQQFLLDADLKLYAQTTFDLNSKMPKMPDMGGMFGGGAPTRQKPATGPKKTGTQEISFTLTEAGTEKIAGFDTKHYIIESSVTSTGCAGKGTSKMKMELWQANIDMPSPCFKTNVDGAIKAASGASIESDCEVKTTFKTDVGEVSKAFGGLTMRMRFGEEGKQVTNEVTMLSQAVIPDSEFVVPEDYKKVSEADLDKARSNAMMKGMFGGGLGIFGGGMPGLFSGTGGVGNLDDE